MIVRIRDDRNILFRQRFKNIEFASRNRTGYDWSQKGELIIRTVGARTVSGKTYVWTEDTVEKLDWLFVATVFKE